MQNWEIIIIIAAFLLIFVLIGLRDKRRYETQIKKQIREQFGQIPPAVSKKHMEIVDGYYNYHKHSTENLCGDATNKISEKRNTEFNYVIDDITYRDLNLDKVYERINYTFSFVGEEYLYNVLRNPCMDINRLEALEKDISFISNHEVLRENLSYAFAKAGKSKNYSIYDCMTGNHNLEDEKFKQNLNKSRYIHYLNLFFLLIAMLMIFVKTGLGILLTLFSISFSVFTYFNEKAKYGKYSAIFQEMIHLVYCGELVAATIKKESYFSQKENNINLLLTNLKSFSKKGKYIYGFNGLRGSGFGISYLNMIFHFDLIFLSKMAAELQKDFQNIDELFGILGYIEMLISVASYRKSVAYYCIPKFDDSINSKEIAKKLYHPLIKSPVDNDYEIDKPMLITGSNASGKSTFLRTVALAMLMSQTIHTVLAKEFTTRIHFVISSMSLTDNLSAGDSYFMAEIKAMKRILELYNQVDENIPVFFVDEVLRGTNTVERIASSTEILRSLSKSQNNKKIIGFAATHDIELTYLLESEYQNYHFAETIQEDNKKVSFDYKLKNGVSKTHNAIALLESLGYSTKITECAKDNARYFMETGFWRKREDKA